jgi:hypothetical protein
MIVYVVIFPFKAVAFSLKKTCKPFSLYSATVTLRLVFSKFLSHNLTWQAVVTVVVWFSSLPDDGREDSI